MGGGAPTGANGAIGILAGDDAGAHPGCRPEQPLAGRPAISAGTVCEGPLHRTASAPDPVLLKLLAVHVLRPDRLAAAAAPGPAAGRAELRRRGPAALRRTDSPR